MEDLKRAVKHIRLRFRRKVRKQKRHVEDMTVAADDLLNRLVFRRFENLYRVRRFVGTWLLLTAFIGFGSIWQVRGLDKYYLELIPADGGIYREGIVGSFTSSSPLFAVTNVDVAVSRLVFSGLFAVAPDGQLRPDLATGYTVDDKNLQYTVDLKSNVVWHDGEKFDADDVLFTYETIKNADVGSSLSSSWQGVAVNKIDEYTVRFVLPNTLSSFKYSMTNGIVPEHVLSGVEPADLRSSTFNTANPIGTGPFEYSSVEVIGSNPEDRQEKITLGANESYHRSRVKMDGAIIRTYRDEDDMVEAFIDRQITSMVGLDTVPDNVKQDPTVEIKSTPLRSSVFAFFNLSDTVLADVKVREALVRASNTDEIRRSVDYHLIEADSPFLRSHFSHNDTKVQKGYDVESAKKLLDEAGWTVGEGGHRYKDGQKLSLRIKSQSLAEYSAVIQTMQRQWGEIGVSLEAVLQPEEEIQSETIIGHDYEILLYGVAIGPDPDVFAYWHSSQADPRLATRLNLSEFSNSEADESLEAGRTRVDESLRRVKYDKFLEKWRDEAPALALYQPRFLFVTRGTIDGYGDGQFNNPSDRFYSVGEWRTRREKSVKDL